LFDNFLRQVLSELFEETEPKQKSSNEHILVN
jgi:hypothetical protein